MLPCTGPQRRLSFPHFWDFTQIHSISLCPAVFDCPKHWSLFIFYVIFWLTWDELILLWLHVWSAQLSLVNPPFRHSAKNLKPLYWGLTNFSIRCCSKSAYRNFIITHILYSSLASIYNEDIYYYTSAIY